MLPNTKEFLNKLADLIKEYKVEIESTDRGNTFTYELVSYNKESFDEFYDR